MRIQLVQKMKPGQNEVVSRLRAQLKDQNVEDVLRKFSRDNKDHISEDELLIALSKLNSILQKQLGDVKELTQVLKDEKGGDKISIAETLQLIGQ